jgi:iron complex outermembrane receptor protein
MTLDAYQITIKNRIVSSGTLYGLLEKASPKYKVGLMGLYAFGPITVNVKETFYGKASALSDPGTGPLINTVSGAAALTDLEVAYKFPVGVTAALGANNLFNKYPDKFSAAFQAACVASGGGCVTQYPSFSPYGINGGYYYGRLSFNF